MKNSVTEKLIAAVKQQAKHPLEENEIVFVRNFYHRLSGQDFTPNKALGLCATALRHRHLGSVRVPGETLVEIYNVAQKKIEAIDDRDTTIINIITDDKPFLISSLTILLNSMHKTPRRVVHPIFAVQRDDKHRMQKMARYQSQKVHRDDEAERYEAECYIQYTIDFTSPDEHKSLLWALRQTLGKVASVVTDWQKMRDHTLVLAEQLKPSKNALIPEEYAELLQWMATDHFTFLGYADVVIVERADTQQISIDKKTVLGILRTAHEHDPSSALKILPPITTHSLTSPIVFTKSRQRSTLQQENYLDCILIDRSAQQNLSTPQRERTRKVGCILGFFASSSILLSTTSIPHLRKKRDYILETSTLRPRGHAYKTLRTLIERLPREQLFQMDIRSLYGLCMTIINHLERRKTRLHIYRNVCGHFYSCLVYVPRDLFNSNLRNRIQNFLGKQLGANEISFDVYFSDSILTRIHYLIYCNDSSERKIDEERLESEIQIIARDWNDNLHEALRQQYGYEKASQVLDLYLDAFPASYQDEFSIDQALIDIDRIEHISAVTICAKLVPSKRNLSDHAASFKLYAHEKAVALSDVLPILAGMGVQVLSEYPYRFTRQDGTTYWLYEFEIVRQDKQPFDIDTDAENFQNTFLQVWYRNNGSDGFNKLTLLAGLNWKEISLVRAYYRYLKQIKLSYSEHYIITVLANNPKLVATLIQLFHARFNPTGKENDKKFKSLINRQIEQISTLDEDRILHALWDVINATVRTNYYQLTKAGESKPYLALKFNSTQIPFMPKPVPEYEIFVYSTRVEGVHLRGGKVARGGLRWSDRAEDFRTEVLGLVKAQRVKNAVIVPVGSKGGFIAKQLPEGRSAARQEVIDCYRSFISGMLDITDNLSGDRIIPPKNVVRLDDDDPYLVVAADKGTSTFSDIANDLAGEYGFWLGDAFASGGSAGYDHKKMGITARGAWESVKRHFRELNKDIQSSDFTTIGIGDMAGDVFGNGMLLSKHIRLIAAFNHKHIFIDPNPDTAHSYLERKRLFALPHSSWDDYDRKCLSAGGGIFTRSTKSITLSQQAKKMLGTDKNKYTPDELINTILKAEVELLWNGGIGTYVKASTETNLEVQDKNNDGVRVDADKLRCKVIGEGGNLGMTQLARIEYSMLGGLCYTDAIDNSAGVDTSDHEVNIKILLNAAIKNKLLAPQKRNAILAKMEAHISKLVLKNNYTQTQIISLEASRSSRLMAQQCRTIDALEANGSLHRKIEFLPNKIILKERREEGKWLTRPELSVLLAYAKMDLYNVLLASDVPDDKYVGIEIDRYFPPLMIKQYPKLVRTHRLKREIICTQITNHLIGTMGPNFHIKLARLTGKDSTEITRAYLIAKDLIDAPGVIADIESLDNKADTSIQMNMFNQLADSMQLCITWLLRNQPTPLNMHKIVSTYQVDCKQIRAALKKLIPANTMPLTPPQTDREPVTAGRQGDVLLSLGYDIDITDIARKTKRPPADAVHIYLQACATLNLTWIQQAIESLPTKNNWQERARFNMSNNLRDTHTAIASKILTGTQKETTKTMIDRWRNNNQVAIQVIDDMVTDFKLESSPDFAMLSILIDELKCLH